MRISCLAQTLAVVAIVAPATGQASTHRFATEPTASLMAVDKPAIRRLAKHLASRWSSVVLEMKNGCRPQGAVAFSLRQAQSQMRATHTMAQVRELTLQHATLLRENQLFLVKVEHACRPKLVGS